MRARARLACIADTPRVPLSKSSVVKNQLLFVVVPCLFYKIKSHMLEVTARHLALKVSAHFSPGHRPLASAHRWAQMR